MHGKISKRVDRWNKSVRNLFAFIISIRVPVRKRAKNPIPNDQTSAIVFVNAVRIPPVMNLMMLWNVQKEVEEISESVDELRVNPKLIKQAHAVMHDE